jgi:hypothetical protein
MKPSTYEVARDEVIALALPSVVLRAFDGETDHPLAAVMRDPGLLWELEAEHFDDYPAGHITPLWGEHGGEVIVGFRHAGGRKGFLRFDLEGDEGPLHEGYSWAQICIRVLLAVHDRGGDVRAAGKALAFPDVDWLVEKLGEAPEDPADRDEWRAGLIGALPAYPRKD